MKQAEVPKAEHRAMAVSGCGSVLALLRVAEEMGDEGAGRAVQWLGDVAYQMAQVDPGLAREKKLLGDAGHAFKLTLQVLRDQAGGDQEDACAGLLEVLGDREFGDRDTVLLGSALSAALAIPAAADKADLDVNLTAFALTGCRMLCEQFVDEGADEMLRLAERGVAFLQGLAVEQGDAPGVPVQ